MKNNRIEKVNSLLKEVISDVIHQEVKNPHIKTYITVTRVDTTPDLSQAKVFFSMIGTDAEKQAALTALQSAAGFIAVNSSKQVRMRYFPQLTFKLDIGIEQHMRIDELLYQIEQERLSRPPQVDQDHDEE